jgi:predicted ribosome quality control (RQC) complex YloA/Tae2 family protein
MKEFIDENNTTYWLGKNAQDNWDIIKKADNNWLWFHLDKFPSGHVIICKKSDTVINNEIIYASKLCISNSKYKLMTNIGIVYCEINNLNIGQEIGSVYFTSNRKTKKLII